MTAEIRLFPCLSDNFGYLIHDTVTKATASIDAPEAGPIVKALQREGWTLTDILVTHHHNDHVGGIAELKAKYNCRVVAPHAKGTAIAQVDERVKEGDTVKVGNLKARVLETPGHTLDHISYVFDDERAPFRLHEIASHEVGDRRKNSANCKRNTPTPIFDLCARQHKFLQNDEHGHRRELTADQRHVR